MPCVFSGEHHCLRGIETNGNKQKTAVRMPWDFVYLWNLNYKINKTTKKKCCQDTEGIRYVELIGLWWSSFYSWRLTCGRGEGVMEQMPLNI